MRGKGGRWEGDPGKDSGVGRRGNREPYWAFEQRSDAQLVGPGRFCAGSYWNLMNQLVGDYRTLFGRSKAPDKVDKREEVTHRPGGGDSVELGHGMCALPSGRDKWELKAFGHAYKPPAAHPEWFGAC